MQTTARSASCNTYILSSPHSHCFTSAAHSTAQAGYHDHLTLVLVTNMWTVVPLLQHRAPTSPSPLTPSPVLSATMNHRNIPSEIKTSSSSHMYLSLLCLGYQLTGWLKVVTTSLKHRRLTSSFIQLPRRLLSTPQGTNETAQELCPWIWCP